MAGLLAQARFIIGAIALAFILAIAVPASAQQPSSVNPTASAVKEQQLLNALRGGTIDGRVSIPDQKSGTLIQPGGRDWRQFHEVTLRWIGAIAILGMLIILVAFYLIRGQVKLESGYSGRRIVRFNGFERFIHWMTATCFIILAISGLNITFGKPLLMPLIGEPAFAGWSQWAKYAHNYLSFPFTIGVFVIFLMWIGGNIPNKVDVEWAKRGGGIVGDDHPPAYRFNGGQKMIYWIVVIGGTAVAITGYLLMFPFYATGYSGHAACPDGARDHRGAVRRRHAGAHLYRLDRHGRRVRGDGRGHCRRQLGEGAPQPVGGAGNGAHRPERVAAPADGHAGRIVSGLGETVMKSFVLAVVAAIAIATIAGFVLNGVQKPADQAYSTTGVRL